MARRSDSPSQMNLFGEPERRSPRLAVGPAPVDPALQELAGVLPDNVRLGTSSWSFPGWTGLVYDRDAAPARLARHGLSAYARHPLLRLVGVDRTFYAPIPVEAYATYAAAVPEDFRFLVKAASQCTATYVRDASGRRAGPNELFLDSTFAAEEVVAPFVEGLGDKAGPLVFQFPPVGERLARDPARFADRLESFLGALPHGPLYAVELRDAELLTRAYTQTLACTGAVHCMSLHPRMPSAASQLEATETTPERGPLIVRWMLRRGLGYDEAKRRYTPFSRLIDEDPDSRNWLAGQCLEFAGAGRDVFITANNKAEGSAPLTVFELARRIAERTGTG